MTMQRVRGIISIIRSHNETTYKFSSIWNLLRDFKTELKRIRGGDWDEDKKD